MKIEKELLVALSDVSGLRWRKSSRSSTYGNCVEVAFGGWRKSSRSGNYGNCLEVAYPGWRKSTYSSTCSNCVEVAAGENAVAARDSKDPHGGVLLLSAASWSSFLHGIRSGRFER